MANVRRIEERDAEVDSLFATPNFSTVLIVFCGLRLFRLVLLEAAFPDGPQSGDSGAELAKAMEVMAFVLGILSAASFRSPLRELARAKLGRLGLKGLAFRVDHAAMLLLAVAAIFEGLHQLVAVCRWEYFWGSGVVTEEQKLNTSWAAPLAILIAFLHVGGLLGTSFMVMGYSRCYRAAFRQLSRNGPRILDGAWELWANLDRLGHIRQDANEEDKRGARDLEAGRGGRGANEPAGPSRVANGPRRAAAAAADEDSDHSLETPRATPRGRGPKPRDPEVDVTPPRKWSKEFHPFNAFGGRGADHGGIGGVPLPARGAAGNVAGAGAGKTPLQYPPRAWLWQGSEWVRVRVLRSITTDGSATVRLPGGGVVQTKQSLLRPRSSRDDEEPPAAPPPPSGRPSSAGGYRRPAEERRQAGWQREPSRERPSSAGGEGGEQRHFGGFGDRGRPAGPPFAGAPPRAPRADSREPRKEPKEPKEGKDDGDGSKWRPYRDGTPPNSARGAGTPRGRAGAGGSPKPSKPAESPVDDEGTRWANERMAKLRKELQEVDKLEHSEKRSKLRALQRELHPDKQPPELRVHAQPLFHLVQKEWEMCEAEKAAPSKEKPAEA
mmetsp:Transcript_79552/g.208919  ORF Transcript_79552/g.208919 Transcript_79552/m.208919 type:complete len:609 (-) Transcript_79552:174-2000(-)